MMNLFIDIHCHPTIKHNLFGYSIFRESNGRKDNNYSNIQVTQPSLKKSGVNGVFASHYLPERNILKDWRVVKKLYPLLKIFLRKYLRKVEKENKAYQQTLKMIGDFESLFTGQNEAAIVHSLTEMQEAIRLEKTFYVHVLEGAHHLGRNLPIEKYLKRIDELKKKGIALITLSHFYPNDIAYPTEGLTPLTKKRLRMRFVPKASVSLTATGKKIVEKMLDTGIIIDLTHTNPTARKEIYEINKLRLDKKRPLVFSHTGVRALFEDVENPRFGLMTADDEEILEIKNCNGVIGIIFMNYWLSGKEEKFPGGKGFGFANMVNTIKHIHSITGSFDHIAIGTDFDGWADSPDDYYDSSMLGDFKRMLIRELGEMGANEADVDKITGGNILRVLEKGWDSI